MIKITDEELEEVLYDRTRQLLEDKLDLHPLIFTEHHGQTNIMSLDYNGKSLFTFNYWNYRVNCTSGVNAKLDDILGMGSVHDKDRILSLRKNHPDWIIWGLNEGHSYDTIIIGTPNYWFGIYIGGDKTYYLYIIDSPIDVYDEEHTEDPISWTENALIKTYFNNPEDLEMEMTKLIFEYEKTGG